MKAGRTKLLKIGDTATLRDLSASSLSILKKFMNSEIPDVATPNKKLIPVAAHIARPGVYILTASHRMFDANGKEYKFVGISPANAIAEMVSLGLLKQEKDRFIYSGKKFWSFDDVVVSGPYGKYYVLPYMRQALIDAGGTPPPVADAPPPVSNTAKVAKLYDNFLGELYKLPRSDEWYTGMGYVLMSRKHFITPSEGRYFVISNQGVPSGI